MQRLAILTFVSFAAAGWMALQQQRLVAFQSQPESEQTVEAADAAAATDGGADTESSSADATPQNGASAPSAGNAAPPPDPAIAAAAEKLLRDARDRLYDPNPGDPVTKSVRAKFTERAFIGHRRFVAEGTYLSGAFPTLRLEYHVQIGGSEGELVEVSDGSILRTSKIIRPIDGDSEEPTLEEWTRKDIKQILAASYVDGTPDAAVLQAELSLGGLPTLLASIERTMVFDTLSEQVWKGRPTTIVEGRWRQQTLGSISQQTGMPPESLAQMIPDRIRIYFDKETLFPMRILYRKLAARDPDRYAPLMSIEFSDVRLNEGVAPEEFRYPPPQGVNENDETAAYLGMIEQLRAGSQAAAGGGPAATPGSAVPESGATAPAEAAPAQQVP